MSTRSSAEHRATYQSHSDDDDSAQLEHAVEDSVPVGVQGERNAAAPYQSLHQQEVTAGILMIAEQGARYTACGIVHGEQDRELRSVLAQPPMVTAVQLDQHALSWHPLAAHPVLGRAPAPRTAEASVDQDTPRRSTADVEALSLTEQLGKMGVVGSLVHRASQVNHPAPDSLGNSVGRLAAPVAMGQGCSAVPPVIRQYAAGVAWAHSHQSGGLVQCHVLREQTVENLESRLFLGSQSHILHEVSVTFLLAS